jgi:hypothetical protein
MIQFDFEECLKQLEFRMKKEQIARSNINIWITTLLMVYKV